MGATTSTNYQFLCKTFVESKSLPEDHPDRILGCGLEGASRTGKDWDKCVFVCQYIWEHQFENKAINFFRDSLANLKKTTYKTLKQVWKLYGYDMSVFNKSATEIHYLGCVITFCGVNDDPMRAAGLESDIALMGEAMSLKKDHCDQIEQRTNELYIYDYNPTASEDHWLFQKEKQKTYRLHKTTVFDNEYAPINALKKIISYAHEDDPAYNIVLGKPPLFFTKESWDKQLQTNKELGTANLYLWQVYGLGKRAIGEDVIFDRWYTYTDSDKPDSKFADWILGGGDFGFSSDPSSFVKVEKHGNNIYIRGVFEETGLLNADIAKKVKQTGMNEYLSVWDSADGYKSVNELREEGLNAAGAKKGAGSVSWGLQYMKKFNLFVHEDSFFVIAAFTGYKWAKKPSGEYARNSMGQRIPAQNQNDHSIDAARYPITYYAEGLEEDINDKNS